MNIIVCCKLVIDPEIPPSSFKVDAEANRVIPQAGTAWVVSPFDEQAVEAALRIKDKSGDKVTVLSLGNNLPEDVVKKPLSMGADELILLDDEAFEGGDSWSTACALASAIKKIGEYDLILCGRQAADWDSGQVGLGIAEFLGIPSVGPAKKVEVSGDKAQIERVTAEGHELIEVNLPLLVTASNELGEPRYPSIRGIMAAKKKSVVVWKPDDIGLDSSQVGEKGRLTKVVKLFQPSQDTECEIIEGEEASEVAANLVSRLKETKVI